MPTTRISLVVMMAPVPREGPNEEGKPRDDENDADDMALLPLER